jgi:serine/threonine-protein kinase
MTPTTTRTSFDASRTIVLAPGVAPELRDARLKALCDEYQSITAEPVLTWPEARQIRKRLGEGGQGVVYLAERSGADGFRLPVALKFFSPEGFESIDDYLDAMARMARVTSRVALIQQDHLIDVNNFTELSGLRVMEMEWVDGYDLGTLLSTALLARARAKLDDGRWAYLNDVVVTAGTTQARLKPGIAVAVLRDNLAALSALHRERIVHGDVKPSNIMLKRTGYAKLIDIGSAIEMADAEATRSFTPAYAAPEILTGSAPTEHSDLASLGYVLIEMLCGFRPFAGIVGLEELVEAKRSLLTRLNEMLPDEVVRSEQLMGLIRGLVHPDPDRRFPDADAADLVEQGAVAFQRQLVRSNLASEYTVEIRTWLAALG